MRMQTVKAIIDGVGGVSAAARILNAPITTVHRWYKSDAAPAWRASDIERLRLAANHGEQSA